MNRHKPDIAYAINKMSIYTSNPSKYHCKTIIRVLKYLRYTLTYRLHYTMYSVILERYSDGN